MSTLRRSISFHLAVVSLSSLFSCSGTVPPPQPSVASVPSPRAVKPPPRVQPIAETCTGTYPSYWQDPKFPDMWAGQRISNVPPQDWGGPVFKLSDKLPREAQDDSGAQAWRDPKYDALFAEASPLAERTSLASEYIWALMHYIQEGNIDSGDVATDWTLCNNKIRNWYHIPFQTYDTLTGREFVHGLTREAPVTFSMRTAANGAKAKSTLIKSTVWAVAFYNPSAAYTLGKVWQADGSAKPPADHLAFDDGAVIGKLLFTTVAPKDMPFLNNVPQWRANISDPAYCSCAAPAGQKCSMADESKACPRSFKDKTGDRLVSLMQFDVAVKDSRAPTTQWVYGTFVADGERKAAEANAWNRIAPLGLMWGNDRPATDGLAAKTPADPRSNGFKNEIIFWDTVDMLNAAGGDDIHKQPGHLGCNSRLNGPADNASSACMSCHMTASVPDKNLTTPPAIAQFDKTLTPQCVTPDPKQPAIGKDGGGSAASVKKAITFAQIDSLYFGDLAGAAPIKMEVETAKGPVAVLAPGVPTYADEHAGWISLDFSLQLAISLTQWGEWLQDRDAGAAAKARPKFGARLPAR